MKTIYARFSSPETSRSRIIITPREMMDRVSRKDHRYVVLIKNDLIASKTFLKFPPIDACLRGNNPFSQFSSIFHSCTVRRNETTLVKFFSRGNEETTPRFFFTRSSSSLHTRNDNSTQLFDEISLN